MASSDSDGCSSPQPYEKRWAWCEALEVAQDLLLEPFCDALVLEARQLGEKIDQLREGVKRLMQLVPHMSQSELEAIASMIRMLPGPPTDCSPLPEVPKRLDPESWEPPRAGLIPSGP